MLGLIALAITAIVMCSICLRIEDWGRDWTTNTATMDPVSLNESSEAAVERVKSWVTEQPQWALVDAPKTEGINEVHLIRKTKFFRFIDDIVVSIQPTESGAIVTATSTSRIGKGDLGQNPRNLRELRAALE